MRDRGLLLGANRDELEGRTPSPVAKGGTGGDSRLGLRPQAHQGERRTQEGGHRDEVSTVQAVTDRAGAGVVVMGREDGGVAACHSQAHEK